MPHPNTNPDADAIYARISLSLAKSQRLFSSLPHDNTDPAPTPTNPNTTSNPDPVAKSDPEPPLIPDSLPGLLGIGATPPSPNSGATDKSSLASDVLLRRQLLGKDWARKVETKKKGQGDGKGGRGRDTIYPKAGKGRGREVRVGARKGSESESEEEDEGEKGRSSLGSVRMKMKWGEVGGGGEGGKEAGDGDGDGDGNGDEGARGPRGKGVKRGGNYLDEVLAERVERRKKRRKKKIGGDKEGEDGSITN
ncbi:hypothetical protein BDR22DRAFT_852301 [Usnea florida]